MKKILHITNRLVIGGPSRHVAMLAKAQQLNYEVKVVGGSAAPGEVLALDLFAELKHQPIRIPELSRKLSLSRDYRVYRKLRQIIHEFQPDIVHTHTAKVGALGRYAAMKEGVPKIIHTYHGLIFENYFSKMLSKSLIKLDRYLASISVAIIVLSQNQQNALVDDFAICPKDKSYIVPLAIDVDEFQYNDETRKLFRHQYNLSSETIAIGILGRLVPIKNIKLFLDGIYYLKNHSKIDIRAFIIGDGVEKEKLINYAQSLGLNTTQDFESNMDAQLVFTSWFKHMKTIYSGLDIIALTSKSEGTPMSLMEAQSARRAVIAADVGGVCDIIQNHDTGLLFNAELREDFFAKLKLLVESQDLRTKISLQAETYARKYYALDLMLHRINTIYENE